MFVQSATYPIFRRKNSSHLHPNRPSDQLSCRTPRRMLSMNPVAKATKRLVYRLAQLRRARCKARKNLPPTANPAPTTMHSPTLANDFPSLDSRLLTVSAASFALRSLPPQQIPCSHTLADSFSLFALFSTLASFVFNDLRTLFAKHRGVGVAPVFPFTSHQPRITNHVSRSPFVFLANLLPSSAFTVPVGGPAA